MKIPKIVAIVAVLVTACIGVFMYQGRAAIIAEHDRIKTEFIDVGKFTEAIAELEAMKTEHPEWSDEINKTIASCYCNIGDDPGVALKDKGQWYRKAEAVQPGCLTDRQKKDIEFAEE
jgi:hypothetical protein